MHCLRTTYWLRHWHYRIYISAPAQHSFKLSSNGYLARSTMVRPSGLLHAAGRVLVLNAGSSSLKFKTFDAATLAPEAWGLAERIGEASKSALKVKYQPTSAHAGATPAGAAPEAHSEAVPLPDHAAALDRILAFLRGRVSRDLHVTAVGHRIVHGLDISAASLLTESVLGKIRKAVALAPLHNPPGLQGVEAAVRIFGSSVPQASSKLLPCSNAG